MAINMHTECLLPQGQKLLGVLKGITHKYNFVLAGGTALALQIGHRISVDLDFFSEKSFSTDALYREFQKAGLKPIIQQETEGALTAMVNEVKVSMLHYPYPFLDKRLLWKGIDIAGIIDIAAMKIMAITQRGAKRGFIDLYFILKDTPFRKIAENMIQRYGADRLNPVNIGKAIIYFTDADIDPDPQYCGREKPEWKGIKKFFVKNVRQMVMDMQEGVGD
ncbi:MAG: nucleotidyl transferase AbiEii/AbiGii toxin family protein [Deltaproteobacteria bacterium]|nr:nucleotidyl transferase AbiEii/AbiGii toxin family protein [Deltaproteobacteria bacterium]